MNEHRHKLVVRLKSFLVLSFSAMAMEWKMLPVHLLLLLSVFLIQQVSSQGILTIKNCFISQLLLIIQF